MNFRLRLFCLYSFTWVNIVPIPPPPHAPGLFVLLSKQDEITLGKLHSLPSNLLVEIQIPLSYQLSTWIENGPQRLYVFTEMFVHILHRQERHQSETFLQFSLEESCDKVQTYQLSVICNCSFWDAPATNQLVMSTTATATHYAKLIPRYSLLHVGEKGAVGPHHLLDRAHPDLPDPLP